MQRVAIIVVIYNPNIRELQYNINTYSNQTNLLIVVDNSDNKEKQHVIKNIFSNKKNIVVITLGDNYGIAYAQNVGIKYAIDKGYKYFIEMDQDSRLPNNYVVNIYNTYISLIKKGKKVAGVGSLPINKNNGQPYLNIKNISDNYVIEVDKTLSSGFFIPLSSLKVVGFKKEELFIDYVDWEWCWRAKSLGYKTYVDTTLKLPHMLGEGHKNFLFFKLGVPSPIRHYYQYRNLLLLSKMKHIPFVWKIKRILIHLSKLILFLCFYDKKVERFKYILKGIKDGILDKKGKI